MQISDELISRVTRELIKRFGSGGGESPVPAPKPLLHLVGGRAGVSPAFAARLEEAFAIREHTAWEDHVPPEAVVLLSKLGIQALVRVASGDEGCTVEGRALLEAILLGRPVAVLESGLAWRASGAPKALAARYAEYEKTLESYGLKIVDEDGVIPALLGRETGDGGPLREAASPVPERFTNGTGGSPGKSLPRDACGRASQALNVLKSGGRRVINEAAIKAACPEARGLGQTFATSPGDILTPLAKDYALAMRINLV
ncbi:MAG: hypothetical protein LBU06_09275 [Desulfovibrio sp.]|jgi:hypothetical protein|nr:hypothetical protein [Desulfovibrio sp.]